MNKEEVFKMEENYEKEDILLEIDRLLNDPKFEKFNNISYKNLYLGLLAMIIIAVSSAYLIFVSLSDGFLLFIAAVISMTITAFVTIKNHNRSYPLGLREECKKLLELKYKIIENRDTETVIILHKAS